ncbi:peptidyl-prolyl cis-trans isomerase FKBP16-3, chloroplastic [Nymphaea colorata]|nr:peptidyl-prolyl cis-trans isomerase FKBP16-3, chloroplastic [Nymphaea colorata]
MSTSLLLSSGCKFAKKVTPHHCILDRHTSYPLKVQCKTRDNGTVGRVKCGKQSALVSRRDAFGFFLLLAGLGNQTLDAVGAGLPPEEKPKLCDDACEKELENVPMVTTESGLQYKDIKIGSGPSPPVGFQVAANYVAMVPSGQIFDSSLEKGLPYLFRVGSGQVIKGLDEGILTMKIGGKRRLYIPGSLAFPKGLSSAPGRPRVAPSSPVIFDVSLEYVPGLEAEEE